MARVCPPLDAFQPVSAGEYAELDCIRQLADGLPSGFIVFHHLPLHAVHEGRDYFGEYDIVVLAPSGRVVSLELKAGELVQTGTGAVKHYGDTEKDVGKQLARQHASLLTSLRKAQIHATVNHFLVLPHHRWKAGDSLSIPRERVIDTDAYPDLARRILRDDMGHPRLMPEALARIEQHLAGYFHLAPDVDRIASVHGELRRRLASGLATWVPRIESASKTYVVEGAAGCGKTQLALALLREACGRGERVLYVCFNRALADHLAQMAPSQARVDTLHGIAREFIERRGDQIDFSSPDVFDWMIAQLAAHYESERGPYDLVILDEGQDFAPDWVSTVDAMGHGEHRLYLLQDDDQRVYRREPFGLEGATTVRTRENFRSPRVVVEMINLLELTPLPIEARSPLAGEAPNVEPYPEGNDRALVKATETAIRRCIAAGYRPDQIAVVSWQGLRSSALHDTRELAGLQIKTFTGKYDAAGNALYTDGQLELETVFRFKGRSMEAVVFTEIDFDGLDAETSRRLYVGLTRARSHLELVTSHRAARRIAERIQGVDGLITRAE
ncbi:ATP-binding domain-containing protein [Niveibacterium sp. COAC-50]|uniref:ATP-binding domain-containing protein n=1 Tax=Niveibacterium sp. COAC-50 TaxID=2729384 RepID=UPI0015535B97|nr:ATP-binding domain-containing protein [Niveibacterium sp. COAC-50]